MCCFVLLTQYWGIVTVPGCPRVNRPQMLTWGGRILTLHLSYVAGYTCPLLVREVKDTLTVFRRRELLNLTMSLLTLQHSRTTVVLLA